MERSIGLLVIKFNHAAAAAEGVYVLLLLCCDYRLRLQEGFHFAHTQHGILSLVTELDMQVTISECTCTLSVTTLCLREHF